MKKKGRFYRGYDSKRDLKEIERPIRNLIVAMNSIPYITTYCSCAGHTATKENNSCRYKCSAFVDFELLKEEYAARDLFARLSNIALIDYPEEYYYLSKRFWGDNDNLNMFWQHKERIMAEKDSKKKERLEKKLENEIKKIKNSHSNLTWDYRLMIHGGGNTKRKARERLDSQIKMLEDFFSEESKK